MTRPLLPSALLLACATLPLAVHGEEVSAFKGPFQGVEELTFLKTGDPLLDWNPRRTWTSTDGRTLRAKLLAARDGQGSFALENGTVATVPIDRLVEDDRRFIREWEAVSEYFNLGYEPSRSVTGLVEADLFDGAFAKEGRVHETRNFRFECDAVLSQEVVKDFSRLFEATYLAVLSHPLALALANPEGGKFPVKLFSRDADYHAAGGSPDAAGVYLIKDRVMLVPLSSLGLAEGGKGWRKSRDFDPRTLIHETTHALTHQWLAHAPMWFVEGFADLVAAIPYKDGRLDLSRHREGMADLAAKKFGGSASRFPLHSPAEIVALGHRAFMGEAEPEEKALLLPRVEPFRIALVSDRKKDDDADTENADTGSLSKPAQETDSAGLPALRPPLPDDGTAVVRRYVSSMALLAHLSDTGQTDALRRYLFDFVHFEWDRERYLNRFETAYETHRQTVTAQAKAFDARLQSYNASADAYNAALARYRSGELDSPPAPPAELEIPEAIPVPEILRLPRSAESLSRRRFLETAWDRHLRAEGGFSLAPAR